jgi:hypothetical protein
VSEIGGYHDHEGRGGAGYHGPHCPRPPRLSVLHFMKRLCLGVISARISHIVMDSRPCPKIRSSLPLVPNPELRVLFYYPELHAGVLSQWVPLERSNLALSLFSPRSSGEVC